MKKYFKYFTPLLVTTIFFLAIYLLYQKLKNYSLEQLQESIQQISVESLCLSFAITIVSYIILVGYDWLALVALDKRLPIKRVALVSFIGQVVSYNFGALLGGTSIRYRFYTSWGFSLSDIVHLVLMLAVTFWVGAFGVCGIVFFFAPPPIPDEILVHIPIANIRVLGALLVMVAVAYLMLCFFVKAPLQIFGKEFVFPSGKIAIAQFLVAGLDIIVAASCMYVLLPEHLGMSFVEFLPGYLLAQVSAVLTHVPGGVGVFELVLLHLTGTTHGQMIFAAVLIFRVIYYIIPLLFGAVIYAFFEANQIGQWLKKNIFRIGSSPS